MDQPDECRIGKKASKIFRLENSKFQKRNNTYIFFPFSIHFEKKVQVTKWPFAWGEVGWGTKHWLRGQSQDTHCLEWDQQYCELPEKSYEDSIISKRDKKVGEHLKKCNKNNKLSKENRQEWARSRSRTDCKWAGPDIQQPVAINTMIQRTLPKWPKRSQKKSWNLFYITTLKSSQIPPLTFGLCMKYLHSSSSRHAFSQDSAVRPSRSSTIRSI